MPRENKVLTQPAARWPPSFLLLILVSFHASNLDLSESLQVWARGAARCLLQRSSSGAERSHRPGRPHGRDAGHAICTALGGAPCSSRLGHGAAVACLVTYGIWDLIAQERHKFVTPTDPHPNVCRAFVPARKSQCSAISASTCHKSAQPSHTH